MKRSKRTLIIAAAVLSLLIVYTAARHFIFRPKTSLINLAQGKRSVKLFFVDESGKIVNVPREIASGATLLDDIKTVFTEESANPGMNGLFNAIPAGATVRGVYVDEKRCVYLDFDRSFVERHGGGTQGELLTLEAVKRTIGDNFRDIDYIKLLVDGKELPSIAGHISTTGKLKVK